MRLHALTAITRCENLPHLALSLDAAVRSGVDLTWHCRFDPDRKHVGGQALKNQMLDHITDGWVYILDDDNLLHPDLMGTLADYLTDRVDVALVVCAQQHPSGFIRRPHRRMLRQTHVDAGQVLFRREALGDLRIPLHYCGDGEMIERFANQLHEHEIIYIKEAVTYYNWLRSDP
jgi:hypothetical protein